MKKNIFSSILLFAVLSISGIAQTSRPNIIFLLTDDQPWNTLGAMGNTIIQTPQIDSLSKTGVTFENAFVTTAICFASRATIFSGQHVPRNKISTFGTPFTSAALAQTYPMLLRKAGYNTGFIGKWGIGGALPQNEFDKWYGFAGQGHYEVKDKDGKVIQHLTAKMGDQAEDFLKSTSASKPFCLSISFKSPHLQDQDPRRFIPDPAYMGLYVNDMFPKPPNSDPAFYQALPAFLRNPSHQLRKRWELEFKTEPMFHETMRNFYRLITGVDVVVGRIRKQLAETGADKNTVIIFTSDHGRFLGERGYAGKWLAYDASIRIPIIIYDPRLPAQKRGLRLPEMVLNLDIPETILSLARVPIPATMQGHDMMQLVHGTAKEWRTEFYYEHYAVEGSAPPSEALVGTRYKYIIYTTQNPKYEELYDLETDPHESVNLFKDPKYAAILDSMKSRFNILKVSSINDNEVKELTAPVSVPTNIETIKPRLRSVSHNPPESNEKYDALGKTATPYSKWKRLFGWN